jgi:hypothetical protein
MTQNINEILEELAVNPGPDSITEAPEPGINAIRDDINATFPDSTIQSAGYVYIWDTQTGKSSVCNRNMLTSTLGKLRKDKSRVFTTIKPDFELHGGEFKCTLHADNEDREHYNSLGLAVCTKEDLDSPYQVTRHMQTRHPQEAATIEDINATTQREEDREFQRLLLQAAAQGITAPAPTLPKPDTSDKPSKEPVVVQCEECGEEFDGVNKMIATNRMKSHSKSEHGGTDGQ